jgi:hypothetical protein
MTAIEIKTADEFSQMLHMKKVGGFTISYNGDILSWSLDGNDDYCFFGTIDWSEEGTFSFQMSDEEGTHNEFDKDVPFVLTGNDENDIKTYCDAMLVCIKERL